MAAAAGEQHELWVFDADEVMQDLIRVNEELKDTLRADIIALSLFFKSTQQSVRQIKLLGVMGRAYHKIGRNGQRYIVFKGYPGLRPNLPGTTYLVKNPKVACFVVGGREIVEDATKATKIAVVLLVAYDVLRELHEDHFSLASLGVRVLSDVLQAAGAAAVGAVAGVLLASAAFPVVATFAIVVVVGFAVGMLLTSIDQHYHLTERARARMMGYEAELKRNVSVVPSTVQSVKTLVVEVREIIYTVDQYWTFIEELRHWLPRSAYQLR